MSLTPGTCQPIPAYTPDACDEFVEPNRIIAVAFVEKQDDTLTLPSNTFDVDLLALEAVGSAFIMRNVNGEKNAGEAVTGAGKGTQPERIVGRQHELQITNFEIMAGSNIDFWNKFQEVSYLYNLYFFTENKAWTPGVKNQIMVDSQLPITRDNQTFIEGLVVIRWNNKEQPIAYDVNVTAINAV